MDIIIERKLLSFYRIVLMVFYFVSIIYIVGVEMIVYGLIEGLTNFAFVDDWVTVILIVHFSVFGLILAFRKVKISSVKTRKVRAYELLDAQFTVAHTKQIKKPGKILVAIGIVYGLLLIVYFLIVILFDTVLLIEVYGIARWFLYPLFLSLGFI